MTSVERAYLSGWQNPKDSGNIRSTPGRYIPKPVPVSTAVPQHISRGTQWRGAPSFNEQFSKLGPKYISQDPSGKYIKNPQYASKLAAGQSFGSRLASSVMRATPQMLMSQSALGMAGIYGNQVRAAGPRDQAALAYAGNTGSSLPEARTQYDNMQQSLLSGGETGYNWDQFSPGKNFNIWE